MSFKCGLVEHRHEAGNSKQGLVLYVAANSMIGYLCIKKDQPMIS